jgi:hypothetical protein
MNWYDLYDHNNEQFSLSITTENRVNTPVGSITGSDEHPIEISIRLCALFGGSLPNRIVLEIHPSLEEDALSSVPQLSIPLEAIAEEFAYTPEGCRIYETRQEHTPSGLLSVHWEQSFFAPIPVNLSSQRLPFEMANTIVSGALPLWPAQITPLSWLSLSNSIRLNESSRSPLKAIDLLFPLSILLGAFLLLLSGQKHRPIPVLWSRGEAAFAIIAFLMLPLILSLIGTDPFVAMFIATGGYVFICIYLAQKHLPNDALSALAFHRVPLNSWGKFLFLGLLCALFAGLLLSLLPQGDSEMTRLLESSKGLLGVVVLALISPWAEELLLRGLFYGALERHYGDLVAIAGSALLFSLLHFGQHWGNLGPWLVVSIIGTVLSIVRWKTGSSLASTLVHLSYNAVLITPVLIIG